jgi:hypothetical protein
MKGLELLASLIAIFMMLGIGALMGGAIIFILNAARQPSADKIDYELYLSPIYPPIKYEAMLLSYLEAEEENSGIQFKKILAYAAYQKNTTNIFVEGDEVTKLSESSYKIFSSWLENNGYLLAINIDGIAYVIAENKRALPTFPDQTMRVKRISVPLYIDRNSFRVYKTRELTLNVTLDFYVQ